MAGIILQLTLSSKLTQSKHDAREFRGDNTVSVILTTSLVEFQMGSNVASAISLVLVRHLAWKVSFTY